MGDFREFQSKVSAWADKQFPLMTEESRLKKITDELSELKEDPSSGEEMADIALVLLSHAEKANVDLFLEMKKKSLMFVKNDHGKSQIVVAYINIRNNET